jgi:hypothetical protein
VPAVVALVESAYRGEESLSGWTSEAERIARDEFATLAKPLR